MGFWEKLMAPARAIEIMEKLKVSGRGQVSYYPEVVANTSWDGWKVTTVLYKREKNDHVVGVVNIWVSEGWEFLDLASVGFYKITFTYGGERRVFPRGRRKGSTPKKITIKKE